MTMVTIAAEDSSEADQAAADLVCDGINDQVEINRALGSGNIQVLLRNGSYQIDAPINLPNGGILRGESVSGAILYCNNSTSVMRTSAANVTHEHVLIESMRITAGTQRDLGCDLRGFVRSQFNRLRITGFDVGVWFGGDLSTYVSCWTNVFSLFYLSNNVVGFRFSGVDENGLPTANNIKLFQGEIICKDAPGAIAVEVIDGGITVESCDIGYANSSDGVVLHANASECRIVNSRFEWTAQESGKYAVKMLNGCQNGYFTGNIYTDGVTTPNLYVQNPDGTRYLQIDAHTRSNTSTSGAPTLNASDFFRLNTIYERVQVADGNRISLFSDGFKTSKMTLDGANGNLTLAGDIVATGTTPTATVGEAAGIGATINIYGSDANGVIRVDVGTSPATGKLFEIVWATVKPSTSYSVVLTAANAGSVTAMQRIYVDQGEATTTSIGVHAATAVPASSVLKFYFHVLHY